jgi:hypothetical protein
MWPTWKALFSALLWKELRLSTVIWRFTNSSALATWGRRKGADTTAPEEATS